MKKRFIFMFLLSLTFILLVALPAVAGTWTKAVDGGFGDKNNTDIKRPTMPFKGFLYSGSENRVTGGEVWRTADGVNWAQVNTDGFGDSNNELAWPYGVFGDHIYVGVMNFSDGGEIWRSDNGTTWTRVASGGFDDTNNYLMPPDTVFDGALYAGSWNSTDGAAIWSSRDGEIWSKSSTDGFGTTETIGTEPMIVFDDHLYAYTENWSTGGEIWRTSDGTTWTIANTGGFGSSDNVRTGLPRTSFGGYLYSGTANPSTGGQVWRTSDGTSWSPVAQSQLEGGGFGDSKNTNIMVGLDFDGYYYASTWNHVSGLEIWRTANGADWAQINSDGFGNALNTRGGGLQDFNGMIYAGTRNTDTGGEIWVYGPYGGGITEPGNNVAVGAGDTVELTFSTVSATGTTSISSTTTALTPPGGLSVLGTVYDVTTTASYAGTITIGIQYDDSGIADETAIKLLHEEGGVLVDRTVSVDTNSNIVTGQISSFSVVTAASSTPATGVNTSYLLMISLALLSVGSIALTRRLKLS